VSLSLLAMMNERNELLSFFLFSFLFSFFKNEWGEKAG
jgi:hypothetical protein